MKLDKCHCDGAGFCEIYQRQMDAAGVNWCKRTSKEKRERYAKINNSNLKNQEKKFGIIIPSFNQIGGVETWLKSICKYFANDMSEICTVSKNSDPSLYKLGVTISKGKNSAIKMCSTFNKVLIWGEHNINFYLSKGRPKELIFMHHGDEKWQWANDIFDIQSLYADKLIAVNRTVADKYNCILIENFVDISRCSETHDPKGKTVTWAHRICSDKQPEIFIEIAKNMPDYNFILCGEGDLKQKILSLMPKNCKYLGSPTNLKEIFKKTSVFISTSNKEAFGYSVGEAILSGVPVVSFDVGLGKDFADVIIKNKFTINDWVSAIKKCAGKKSNHSQKLIENYNEKIFYDKWNEIINSN